jgi:hypothetical protein
MQRSPMEAASMVMELQRSHWGKEWWSMIAGSEGQDGRM